MYFMVSQLGLCLLVELGTTAPTLETIGPVTNMFYTRDKCDKEIIFFVFQGEQ